jgi:hypothetical protein
MGTKIWPENLVEREQLEERERDVRISTEWT